MELQDHFAALSYIRRKIKARTAASSRNTRLAEAHCESRGEPKPPIAAKVTKPSSLDGRKSPRVLVTWDFATGVNASAGWIDLELLLRTLARVHAATTAT